MDEHVESSRAVSEFGLSEPGASEAAEQSSSPPAEHEDELSALEARLETRIQEEVERRFQSAKDKRWAQLEKQYGELRDLTRSGSETAADVGGDSGATALTRARRLLAQAGLDADPEALNLLKGYSEAPGRGARLLIEVAELALRRIKREPVNAGTVIQPGGGMAAPDLRADYERALKRVRPGDVAGLTELKRAFRKKGLEVY